MGSTLDHAAMAQSGEPAQVRKAEATTYDAKHP